MIIYHLLHFLNPIQHPVSWQSWDENTGTLQGQSLCLRPPDPDRWVPWHSLGMSLSMSWKEGKSQSDVWAVQPGLTIWPHFSGSMGGWMIFEHRTRVQGKRYGSSPSSTSFSLSPPSFWPSDFLLWCNYCLLSLLCRKLQQQEYRNPSVFAWPWCPSPRCRAYTFLAMPWLWQYHLSAQGKEVGLHWAGDECPGGIWRRVQEIHQVPFAGRRNVSCPSGKLCLNRVQEALEKLSTCHWDSMMHFPVV